jgi:subtilase family serine protease
VRRTRRRILRVLTVGAVAAGSPLAYAVATATASSPLARVGSTPVLPHGARVGNAVPASSQLQLTIALQPRDPSDLQALATAMSTPGSPQFRHYLTVDRFAQRFGATSSQVSAVRSALQAQGLDVGTPTANDLTIPVTGTTAQVEKAFSVSESQVTLPGGRVAFANDQAPLLRASIARDVQGVIGLDDVARPQPQGLKRVRSASAPHLSGAQAAPGSQAITSGPQPCAQAVADSQGSNLGGGPGYTADEVASAYGMSAYYPGNEGAGQTVALVEFGPYSSTDIATYQACYGTSATLNNVDVDGGPGAFPTSGGDDGEAALDIDQVIGLAPRATVDIYQAPTTGNQADILTAIASQNVAKVTSSSWGACETLTGQSVINSESTTLQEMAVQGQSFFISSGDSGSLMCYQATHGTAQQNDSLSVIDPGAQPFATGVGGTYLGTASGTLPDNGSYAGEQVWNDGIQTDRSASASGGGVSNQWPMPAYQSGAAGALNVVQSSSSRTCGNQFCRQVPDVSADADPNSGYVVYSTDPTNGAQWGITGGTSAAAPLWAAFTALANASPTCRGLTVGFENPALYAIAGSAYAANFHDITQVSPFAPPGATGNDPHPGLNPQNPNSLYPVQAGYDMGTGLGTPVANVVGNSLCALRAPVYSVSVANPGAQLSIRGHAASLAVRGADSGSAALSYTAAGLPAGLTINPATGVITGTPSTNQSTTVTVAATDAFTNTGSTAFTWAVVTPGRPAAVSPKVSGLTMGKPKLAFVLRAGSFAPALQSVSITLPRGLSFAKKLKSLEKGITVKSGSAKVKFSVKASGGTLTITFKSAVPSVSLTLGSQALTISTSTMRNIRKHKVKTLTVTIRTTDASKRTVRFGITLTKLS